MDDTKCANAEVDVIVPCYNYGRFLRQCVRSILNQAGVSVRVLIIDDASEDETENVAQALAAEDSRVSYRRHTENQGHIATYNEGLLRWAEADYSLLISADDLLAPGALRRAAALLDSTRSLVMVYGMARVFCSETVLPTCESGNSWESCILSGWQFLDQCFEKTGSLVPTPTAVVRTSAQKQIGGYTLALPHSADVEMWMRFAFRGDVGVVRATQAYYRWHGANMGARFYAQELSDKREFLHACELALKEYKGNVSNRDRWWEAVRGRVGEDAFWRGSKAFDRGDEAAWRAWHSFAMEIVPNLAVSPLWWRFQAKRAFGMSAWQRIRPLLDSMRGLASAEHQEVSDNRFREGDVLGWWPATK